jgi:hypothetical protein
MNPFGVWKYTRPPWPGVMTFQAAAKAEEEARGLGHPEPLAAFFASEAIPEEMFQQRIDVSQ